MSGRPSKKTEPQPAVPVVAPQVPAVSLPESQTTTALALVTQSITELNKVALEVAELEPKYKDVVFDVTTTAGMKAACEARLAIRKPRYTIQKMQKDAKTPLNTLKKGIDDQVEAVIARITAIEDPIHEQISNEETRKENEKKAREEVERKRVAAITERIETIRDQVGEAVGEPAAAIKARIQALVAMEIGDDFAEFKRQAEGARETTLIRLRSAEAKQVLVEADQERIRLEGERLARERQEHEARQNADRVAREEEERVARVAREAEERKQAALVQLNQARISEIQGLQQQVMIASIGRAGVRRGYTRQCIVDTLEETRKWPVTEEHFGSVFFGTAAKMKADAVTQIEQLLVDWDARVAEEARLAAERQRQQDESDRLAAQQAESDRLEAQRKTANDAEQQRLNDQREQLREQEESQRMREVGDGAPVGATASESGDSNIAKALTEPETESSASSTSGPEATAPQGNYIDIVFDGPPSHESGRFVEVEDASGKGVSIGEWIHRPDKYWALRIPRTRELPKEGDPVPAEFSEQWVEDACDSIDAGFFSGDTFHSAEAVARIEYYMGRWQRRIEFIRELLGEDQGDKA